MIRKLLTIVPATLMLLAVSPPAVANAVAVGAGQATFFFCPPGSDKIPMVGADDGFGFWTFVVGDVNTSAACAFAFADVYQGFFTPTGGGCLVGTTDVLCLGFVEMDGVTFEYALTSFVMGTGTASLVIDHVG